MNHDNAEVNDLDMEKMAKQTRKFGAQLKESSKQFNDKLAFDREKLKADTAVKEKQIAKQNSKTK